jgi:molecular chaperone DnaK
MRSVMVSRTEFERLTADLLEKTCRRAEQVLTRAGLDWSDVSRVLLVGGATRMPMVSKLLQQRSGRVPDQHVSPDEAVCRGAAIYAGHLLGLRGRSGIEHPVQVANISTHSLGIQGINPKSGQKINRVLIPRGTPLPARVTKEFVTKASAQRSISITVLEGDSAQPNRCVAIGRAVLRELPADLATEWPVEVTCEYSPSGRLTVDARIRYTDRTVHLELLRPCGVSQTHLDHWKAAVGSAAGFSVFEDLSRRERQAEAPPPIALAVSPPLEEEEASEGRLLSFLQRYMPFAFRGAEQVRSTADEE